MAQEPSAADASSVQHPTPQEPSSDVPTPTLAALQQQAHHPVTAPEPHPPAPQARPQQLLQQQQPSAQQSEPQHPPPPQHSQDAPAPDGAPAAGADAAAAAAELARLQLSLGAALRRYPDFPAPGVLFEDIFPLLRDPVRHADLLRALALLAAPAGRPDVIVGLDARGFLFGPGLALRLGAGFVPVRKPGKLPGPTVQATFRKEYGEDRFEMQADAIRPGQRVLVVDDLVATGGSAAAAGELVEKLGGELLGYVFLLELKFLKARERLRRPVYALLASQESPNNGA